MYYQNRYNINMELKISSINANIPNNKVKAKYFVKDKYGISKQVDFQNNTERGYSFSSEKYLYSMRNKSSSKEKNKTKNKILLPSLSNKHIKNMPLLNEVHHASKKVVKLNTLNLAAQLGFHTIHKSVVPKKKHFKTQKKLCYVLSQSKDLKQDYPKVRKYIENEDPNDNEFFQTNIQAFRQKSNYSSKTSNYALTSNDYYNIDMTNLNERNNIEENTTKIDVKKNYPKTKPKITFSSSVIVNSKLSPINNSKSINKKSIDYDSFDKSIFINHQIKNSIQKHSNIPQNTMYIKDTQNVDLKNHLLSQKNDDINFKDESMDSIDSLHPTDNQVKYYIEKEANRVLQRKVDYKDYNIKLRFPSKNKNYLNK